MKLFKNIDTISFLEDVKKCSGEVFFESEEGDRLNLKSTLSQYIFFVADFNYKVLEKGKLSFDDTDFEILKKYFE